MSQKRALETEGAALQAQLVPASAAKRSRREDAAGSSSAIVPLEAQADQATALIKADQAPTRTSRLQAPIMLLEGHTGACYTTQFDTSGQFLASAGKDKNIRHKNAILQLRWGNNSRHMVTACADKTVGLWDVDSATKLRTWKSHSGIVNCVDATVSGPSMAVSGSDDGTVRLWDFRQRGSVHSHSVSVDGAVPTPLPVTAVAFAEGGSTDSLYFGGVAGDVVQYDVRAGKERMTLTGHDAVITGLSVSSQTQLIASHGADGSVRLWDTRPFAGDSSTSILGGGAAAAPTEAHPRQRALLGRTAHSAQRVLHRVALSPDASRVAAGSADEMLYVWHTTPDAEAKRDGAGRDARLQYALPGHTGAVTEVAWSPMEPIIASCGLDGKVYLGELKQT